MKKKSAPYVFLFSIVMSLSLCYRKKTTKKNQKASIQQDLDEGQSKMQNTTEGALKTATTPNVAKCHNNARAEVTLSLLILLTGNLFLG